MILCGCWHCWRCSRLSSANGTRGGFALPAFPLPLGARLRWRFQQVAKEAVALTLFLSRKLGFVTALGGHAKMPKSLREHAITALRQFTETEPTRQEIDEAFEGMRNDPNDRAVALVGAAFVDDAARAAIQSKYRGLSGDERSRLFGPEAPVGSFGARIKIAFAMSLCSRAEERDLNCIRVIRNAFAHVGRPLDFQNEFVASVCDHFHAPGPNGPAHARNRYLWTVGDLSAKLWATALGFENLDDVP